MEDQKQPPRHTWQDLKDFVNNLNEQQLAAPFIIFGEGLSKAVVSIELMVEDYILADEHEGWEDVRGFTDEQLATELKDCPRLPIGAPMIYID